MKLLLSEPTPSPERQNNIEHNLMDKERNLQNESKSSNPGNSGIQGEGRDSTDSFRLPKTVSDLGYFHDSDDSNIRGEEPCFYSDEDLKYDVETEREWRELAGGSTYRTRLMRLLVFVFGWLGYVFRTSSKPVILAVVPSFLRKSVELRFFSSSVSPVRNRFRWIERHRPAPKPGAKTSDNKKPASPTQFPTLDGLRGLSCIMVLHSHWTYALMQSYAYESGAKNTAYVFRLPFLRLLWSGQAQVDVFFVISGYVLSVKALWLIRQQRYDQVFSGIVSSVFRRAIRIFGPVVCLLLGVFLPMIQLGMYKTPSRIWFDAKKNGTLFPLELHESTPPILPSNNYAQPPDLWANFTNILGALLSLFDPSSELKSSLGTWKPYDNHLWTMPVEFYCSMQLFMVLLATCRLTRTGRLLIHGSLVVFCWFGAHFRSCLFFSGMLAAELDLQRREQDKEETSWDDKWKNIPRSRIEDCQYHDYKVGIQIVGEIIMQQVKRCTLWSTAQLQLAAPFLIPLALFGSLYLLSVPNSHGEETTGFKTIFKVLTPSYMNSDHSHRAIRSLGAIGVTWILANVKEDMFLRGSFRKRLEESLDGITTQNQGVLTVLTQLAKVSGILFWIFTNPVMHYLGQISFALYLTHGTVIRSLGYVIMPYLYHGLLSQSRRLELHKLSKMKRNMESGRMGTGDHILESAAGFASHLLSRNSTEAAHPQVAALMNSTANVSSMNGLQKLPHSSRPAEIGLTTAEYGIIWAVGYLIILPASIWAADLFWRCFDVRCVRFGKWVEESMSVKIPVQKTNTSLSFTNPTSSNGAASLPLVFVQRPSIDADGERQRTRQLRNDERI